jgi:hypothetical protein
MVDAGVCGDPEGTSTAAIEGNAVALMASVEAFGR